MTLVRLKYSPIRLLCRKNEAQRCQDDCAVDDEGNKFSQTTRARHFEQNEKYCADFLDFLRNRAIREHQILELLPQTQITYVI